MVNFIFEIKKKIELKMFIKKKIYLIELLENDFNFSFINFIEIFKVNRCNVVLFFCVILFKV